MVLIIKLLIYGIIMHSIAEFYNFTEQITGYSYIDCENSNLQFQNIIPLKSTNSVIDSIYPLFVYGGIKDTLSFFGSGFGNVRGTGNVYFKNSDDISYFVSSSKLAKKSAS